MKQSTNIFLSLFSSAVLMTGCGSESAPTATPAQQKTIDSLSKVYSPEITEAFGEAKIIAMSQSNLNDPALVIAKKEAEINKENADIRLKLTYNSTMFSNTPIGVEGYVEMDKKLFPIYKRDFHR